MRAISKEKVEGIMRLLASVAGVRQRLRWRRLPNFSTGGAVGAGNRLSKKGRCRDGIYGVQPEFEEHLGCTWNIVDCRYIDERLAGLRKKEKRRSLDNKWPEPRELK